MELVVEALAGAQAPTAEEVEVGVGDLLLAVFIMQLIYPRL